VPSSEEERVSRVDPEEEGTKFPRNAGKPIIYHFDMV
jgi:hypothetical protein